MNLKPVASVMLCGLCKKYYCETKGVQTFSGLTEDQIAPKIVNWKKKQICVKVRRSSGGHLYKLKCPTCRTQPEPDPPE